MKVIQALRQTLGVCALIAATQGSAIVSPVDACHFSGEFTTRPYHPGPADTIRYWVGTFVFSKLPEPRYVFVKSSVEQGFKIEVDVLATNAVSSPLPGYVAASTFDDTLGAIGPLAAGNYTVTPTLRMQDPITGEIKTACTPIDVVMTVFATLGATEVADVIEFYNAQLDHYFITQFVGEIALLDAGSSWKRTGQSFRVYVPTASDGRGAPVARFYGLPSAGLDSHFYSWSSPEVSTLENLETLRSKWKFETGDAFEAVVPELPSGTCGTGTIPVYRLWNGRIDSAHRYTTDVSSKQAMIASGYVPEGYGPDSVFMCAFSQ